MEVISIKNLSKSYKIYKKKNDRLKELIFPNKNYSRDFMALKNINLSIKEGEIVGFIGRNGAGKSTLLKLITGVIQPSTGEVEIKGRISAILELSAGFNPEFTGRENIKFFCEIMEYNQSTSLRLEQEIIEFSELSEFIDRPLKTYSSGMKSKFAFAVNTHIDPDILILDEVLSVGDETFKRKSFLRMLGLIKSGKTVLFVSHNIKSVREICTRGVILDQGEIIFDGDVEDAVTNYQLMNNAPNKNILVEIRKKIISGETFEEYEGVTANFNPTFLSKNRKIHKYYDVDIIDISIIDNEQKNLTVLKTNTAYKLTFNISTKIDVKNLSTRFNIKSESNIPLAASTMVLDPTNSNIVRADSTTHVEWQFDCNLLPGTYFGNVSVSGEIDGKNTVLCRIVDAYSFKVEDDPKFSNFHDLVFLNQKGNMKVLN